MTHQGSKVLFIAPKFFGYEQEIKLELEQQGFLVDWFNDRPSSTPLMKALIRFKPELVAKYSDNYFNRIISNSIETNYDFVFVIKGEALSVEHIKRLKESQTNAKFVYYSWDSLNNFKNSTEKLGLFNKAFSFDRDDCDNHSSVTHLPLFYIRLYERIRISYHLDFDLLFLGSIHSDRFPVIQRIWAAAQKSLPTVKLYSHFFYQSKWVFTLRKAFDASFRNIPWPSVNWDSLDTQQTIDLISRSKIVVDVHHPTQKGLTMRSIEALGAQKKLITTNQDVLNYDFYSSTNILVIDRLSPVIPSSFLNSSYEPLPAHIYEKYSLRTWLNQIFAS